MSEGRTYVAVVDDDDSFSRAISRLLRAAGIESAVFASAEAFLRDPTRPAADCLVLDIQLGGMSGLDLHRQLSSHGKVAPVIFVTAHDEPDSRVQAHAAGCVAYLRKPFRGELLLEAIRHAVGGKPETPKP